jgi:dCTP deaminase
VLGVRARGSPPTSASRPPGWSSSSATAHARSSTATASSRACAGAPPGPGRAADAAADAIEAELRASGASGDPVLARRGDGDGAAPGDRPDRLHPLRQRTQSRGPRGPQAGSTPSTRSAGPPAPSTRERPLHRDIRAALESGAVRIDPYDAQDLQPSSVDLHLDRSFRVFRNNRYPYIDVRAPQPDLTELLTIADDEPFILHPGEFVLGQTLEWVELPDDLVARLEGKSSLGRLGLLIHSTAGYVDPGWKGNLTLELSNVANLPIAPTAACGSARSRSSRCRHRWSGAYGSPELRSRYQGQKEPTASAFHRDFEKS